MLAQTTMTRMRGLSHAHPRGANQKKLTSRGAFHAGANSTCSRARDAHVESGGAAAVAGFGSLSSRTTAWIVVWATRSRCTRPQPELGAGRTIAKVDPGVAIISITAF